MKVLSSGKPIGEQAAVYRRGFVNRHLFGERRISSFGRDTSPAVSGLNLRADARHSHGHESTGAH